MALTAYQAAVTSLLQNPAAPTTLYSTTNINTWINQARGQLAGETECIRRLATLTLTPGTPNYNFSSVATSDASIQGIINVRSMLYTVGSGFQMVYPRPWEWFQLFHQNNPVPTTGAPVVWAQYLQGAASPGETIISTSGGSFWVDPAPDLAYNLTLDCSCYPVPLVNDGTPEAIPYLWTDAVPFLAAWYALLSSQMQARRADAEAYYGYYQTFAQRARQAANPSVNRWQYEGSQDPAMLGKLGVQPAAGGSQ